METEIQYITETMEADEQDWSFQENKKRQVWSDEETLALLKCMQRRDISEGNLSDSKFAATLVKPMETLGFVRTPHQIKIKMKSLRQSYHQCKKNGCSPAALNDCPYYDILASIYEDRKTLSDSDTEPIDSNVWTENEIMKMLSIIDELNLVHELSLNSFSMGALRLVTKALKSYGYDRNVNQVKLALMSLKTTYIESKLGVLHGETDKCLYFEILDEIWGSDEVSLQRSNELIQCRSQEKVEFWSEEETMMLLELVRKLKIELEAFKCSDFAANQLQEALKANGHHRNWKQVKNKLSNLKRSFFEVKQSGSSKLFSSRFPFYKKYQDTFQSEIETSDIHFVTYEETQKDDASQVVSNSGRREKKKQNRGPAWSEEETILVLALLQELDLIDEFKDRMTLEAVSKLVEPLAKQGFNRTASQIKIKMKNLRTNYQRCIQAGCTPQALAECPFYNRLHAIFDKVPGTPKMKKLETIQRLEPVDREVYVENISDHSYNVQNTCKKIKLEESGKEVWYPVEAIESIIGPNDENCKFEKYDEEVAEQSDSEDSHVTGFEEVDEGEYLDSRNLQESYQSQDTSSLNLEKTDAHTILQKSSKEGEDTAEETESAQKLSDILSEGIGGRHNSDMKEILKLSKQNLFVPSDSTEIGSKRTLLQQRVKERNLASHDGKTNCQPCMKAMKQIMSDVLRHEKLMQQQHQIWMERQFELQRKHDREQRELFLNELREFRQLITSSRNSVEDDKS